MKKLGVIGYPIGQSRSVPGWVNLMNHHDIDGVYEKREVRPEEFNQFMEEFEGDENFLAFNATIPHKESVMRYLERHGAISPDARLIGAVNLVKKTEDGLVGYNTDWCGFGRSLREADIYPNQKSVVVLGAGGAARAVVYSLIMEGAGRIFVCNRKKERALKIGEEMYEVRFKKGVEMYCGGLNETKMDSQQTDLAIEQADIIVNATSAGMLGKSEDSSPLFPYQFEIAPKTIFVDIVFNPRITKFLKQALDTKHIALTGEGMFVGQLCKGFEIVFEKELGNEDVRLAWEGAFGPGSFKNFPGLLAPEQKI